MHEGENSLDAGIQAFKAGNKEMARAIFLRAVREQPDSERSWGWLSNTAPNTEELLHCLRQVVRINPQNAWALKRLKELETQDWTTAAGASPPWTFGAPAQSRVQSAPARLQSAPSAASGETLQVLIIVLLVIMILYWLGIGFVQLAASTASTNSFDMLCWGGWNVGISIINGLLIPPVVAKKKSALRAIYFLAVVGSVFGLFQMLVASASLQVCAIPLYIVLGLLAYANKDAYVN